MNIQEAVNRACEEKELIDALTFICNWEADRAIKQAIKNHDENYVDADGKGWDTCFKICIKEVLNLWNKKSDFLNRKKEILNLRQSLKHINEKIEKILQDILKGTGNKY